MRTVILALQRGKLYRCLSTEKIQSQPLLDCIGGNSYGDAARTGVSISGSFFVGVRESSAVLLRQEHTR